MRISDWSSDVCSSDLELGAVGFPEAGDPAVEAALLDQLVGAGLALLRRCVGARRLVVLGDRPAIAEQCDRRRAVIEHDAAVGVGEPQGQGIVLDQGAELQLVLAQRLLDRKSTRLNSSN